MTARRADTGPGHTDAGHSDTVHSDTVHTDTVHTSAARTSAVPRAVGAGRGLLIAAAVGFLLVFLVLPLCAVFVEALRKGVGPYAAALVEPDTVSAILLTLLTAVICVPMNMAFGIVAAWAIAKHDFRGKSMLVTLIDLPFSVSPVVAGLSYMLVVGAQGWIGPWLMAHNLKIAFAVPGIVLVTTFVTLPLVARELIPLMEAQGSEEEEAAIVLGARGWQAFWHVTLPNVRWGLLYGVILCNARAMGEFGAVSVISGHIRGLTNTIPLQVEILYNEYQIQAGFAVASLLAVLALVTLAIKTVVQWRHTHALARQDDAATGAPAAGSPALRAPAVRAATGA